MSIDKYNNNELLYMIRQKDEQAFAMLIENTEEPVTFLIRKCNKKGIYTKADYYQLALIKLVQAIENYREDGGASFTNYYLKLVHSSYIDHFRNYSSNLGYVEMYNISMDRIICEKGTYYAVSDKMFVLPKEDIAADLLHILNQCKLHLKPLETRIVVLRLSGYSYRQIAEKLNVNIKKVDNTMRKVRNWKTNES